MNHINTIEVKNFTKSYRGKKVIDDVSFQVKGNTIHGFIGPNGAGKSTTLNALMSLTLADSGELLIEGKKTSSDPTFNENVGYVPAEPLFPTKMKVKEYVEFCGLLRDIPSSKVNKIFNNSSLFKLANQRCTDLSTGQKKLLQLFGIKIYQTEFQKMIYILDEPFNGLDPTKRSLLANEIKKIKNEGGSVLISTHILSDLQELADDITMIKPEERGSRIVYTGPKTADIQKTYEQYFINENQELFA